MQMNLAQQSNNDNSDFLPGDVVVYMNHIKIDALKTVEAFQPNEYYWLVCGQLVHRDDIRSASAAELSAEMRLGGGV
ncbi:hypothetical protein B9T24_10045 [Acinetobacter sp. ANC 4654]|uniref:hypothetical protein n=1 Tax=Acinetobacter sp. ANC 4654 TaxID=1977872 RepID=UPI000A34DCA7|nr:hypothetical protein [Acinetobacter sp. ANC 4654]OTG95084.1 hypothetical protein B9T24_10045 [Acinetobacter sp. ANC 4654]